MNEKWNIGFLNKGKHLSNETKQRISQKKKDLFKQGLLKLPYNLGEIPWNKGRSLTAKEREKISTALKGRKAWNEGKKWSDEVRKKISKSKKGSIPWNLGVKRTEEEKQKMRDGAKKMWERRRMLQSTH